MERDALDVVAMMVGHEDVGQRPAPLAEDGLDDLCVGSIDRGGAPGFEVVHEVAKIVGSAGEEFDENGHRCMV